MTDRLDDEARLSLINYRIEKARQTIKEADVLADSDFYNTAINRLYYAVYYAASALMVNESLQAATHNGIKTMLGLKFVHTGKLEREYGQIYQRLFEGRQTGDYDDFIYYDKDDYADLRPMAIKFIDKIESMVI